MKIIFENENGRIFDLGMRGEYPWSSKVGRRLEMGDRQEEIWFATEINPRGLTRCDRKVEEWKAELMGKPVQPAEV
jgi:hypothetical protein